MFQLIFFIIFPDHLFIFYSPKFSPGLAGLFVVLIIFFILLDDPRSMPLIIFFG